MVTSRAHVMICIRTASQITQRTDLYIKTVALSLTRSLVTDIQALSLLTLFYRHRSMRGKLCQTVLWHQQKLALWCGLQWVGTSDLAALSDSLAVHSMCTYFMKHHHHQRSLKFCCKQANKSMSLAANSSSRKNSLT